MAKIIDFKKVVEKKMKKVSTVDLYFKYFKTASECEQEWTMQMVGYDLKRSLTDTSYIKQLQPQEVLELYGLAAVKRQLKTAEATSQYYKKLSEIIEKYGERILKDVKTN